MEKEEIYGIEIPKSEISLYAAQTVDKIEFFDEIEDLIEFVIENKGQENKNGDSLKINDFTDIKAPGIYRYDYFKEFYGKQDVFRSKRILDFNVYINTSQNGFKIAPSYGITHFYAQGEDKEHYEYLYKPAQEVCWLNREGSLHSVATAFSEKGIKFSKNLYEEEINFQKKIVWNAKKS